MYVHNILCMWVQVGKEANSGDVRLAAKVTEPTTGLQMTVLTNAPGENSVAVQIVCGRKGDSLRTPDIGLSASGSTGQGCWRRLRHCQC